ncbi:MAG: hypothetical protein U0M50_03525, partial [Paramuribaculum sp.]
IAHNDEIGSHTVMSAQVGIAGSTKVGEWCMFGGQVGIAGHATIANRTMAGAQSGIPNTIKKEGTAIQGSPAIEGRSFWKSRAIFKHLPDMWSDLNRMKKEIENIKNFVTGSVNAGKVWVSSYFIDSYGKEQRMVRINLIDTSKEGGDWSDDIQESSNMMCYGLNIHPNLVGAVPGKSQSNNSGSDKRELFTLKQSLETAFHDMLSKVHELIIFFNGWEKKVRPQVPIVLLTTLDKNTDAVKKNPDGSTSDPND